MDNYDNPIRCNRVIYECVAWLLPNMYTASDSGFLSDPMLLGEDPVYDRLVG